MPQVREVFISNLQETERLAQCIAPHISRQDVIALQGDLGAGKTAFARCLINALTPTPQEVLSPTFTLVQTFDTADYTIWHYDLYRMKDASESVEIGIEEAFDEGVCIIEWPQIIEDILPRDRLLIEWQHGTGDSRTVTLQGFGQWESRLAKVIA